MYVRLSKHSKNHVGCIMQEACLPLNITNCITEEDFVVYCIFKEDMKSFGLSSENTLSKSSLLS